MNFLFTIGRIMKIFEKIIVNHISPKDTKLDPRNRGSLMWSQHFTVALFSNNQLILSRGKQHIFFMNKICFLKTYHVRIISIRNRRST